MIEGIHVLHGGKILITCLNETTGRVETRDYRGWAKEKEFSYDSLIHRIANVKAGRYSLQHAINSPPQRRTVHTKRLKRNMRDMKKIQQFKQTPIGQFLYGGGNVCSTL